MKSDPHQSSSTERLDQLIADMERHRNAPDKVVSKSPSAPPRSLANLVGVLVFGVICFAAGSWVGHGQRFSGATAAPPNEPELLVSQGWRHDRTGVFYRWCPDSCNAPRIYGGGVIKVFEVKCLQRPCGDLAMHFNVLNSRGDIVDKIGLTEKGLQGETRRFLIESQNSEAVSFELIAFNARARV
ncbi:MAG: hypothetical protein VKK62_07575 [Synechococcaceae cyanobacterium]|nr:hypothetical protein [Synechococcaceae cyanobacterium]